MPLTRGLPGSGWPDGALLRLVDHEAAGVLVTLTALAIAVGIGAVHALGPGHGKALIGAYLVGSQGRARDAVALGGVVGLMHTGSVLVLGLVMYTTQRMHVGDRLETALTMISATAITAVGAVLLRSRLRPLMARRRAPDLVVTDDSTSPHGHGHHDHDSDLEHGHGHHHHAHPAGIAPTSRAGLVALASSGGLLPSPSALLVLASAMAIGRTGFGLALVVAFSLGLAAALTAIGLAFVYGRRELRRRARKSGTLRWSSEIVPVIGAATVFAGGLLLAGTAVLPL